MVVRTPQASPERADRCRKSLYQTLTPHGAEAIATVNGLVAPGQKGYLGVNATLGAHCGVHLPLATAVASATATATATATVSSTLVPAG